MNDVTTIAIIGGTGDLGGGLARRWLTSGYRIIIGSRSLDKADAAVAALRAEVAAKGGAGMDAQAMTNGDAAAAADVVVMTVPFSNQLTTLESIKTALQGKILVDVTVPLVPPKVARVQLPDEGSAAQRSQNYLGDGVMVVSAFQNVAAAHLQDGSALQCDVLVCGNNKAARETVVQLVKAAGMRGFHAGSIANSAASEALTSLLIFINKQYRCHSGIRITGPESDELVDAESR